MNRISYRQIKNRSNHKLPLKEAQKDNNKLQKLIQINDFNIIELNEEEVNLDIEPNINIFSEREILRLKKKAKQIEEYYSNKSEDTNINENCFNCLMSNFKPNELLYFNKRKDLLTYLKYCFYFSKKILFFDNQIYIENRYDLDKCDTNYLNGWKFFIPKTVCRACFLQIINSEHLFGNLKTIFSDIDPHMVSRSVHRNRSHFNSRSRASHSLNRNNIKKNINLNDEEHDGKNKIIISEKESHKKIKNIKYNNKSNHNISYDDKNGLISIKKNILGEFGNLVNNKKEENIKKLKNHNNKKINTGLNTELNNQNDEQSVTEIKIKANEFSGEGNSSEFEDKMEKNIKDYKTNKNKNKELSLKDENKINKNHLNNKSNHNNLNSNNNDKILINEILITNKKNNENELKEEKSNNNINKNKKNMNIFNEILNIKQMSNKIVFTLYFKLKLFKDILLYTIMNIGDFKEKLVNSMNFNPDIISYGINQYEQYFSTLYNEGFKARKECEEIFSKIKKGSIPSILRNILKLKEQEKLGSDEHKNLEELEKKLNEYSQKIDDIEKKYEDSLNNFYTNFVFFFSLIKELKSAFSPNYIN